MSTSSQKEEEFTIDLQIEFEGQWTPIDAQLFSSNDDQGK